MKLVITCMQEVIIQNFRAKRGTAMASSPEPPLEELLWTVALARLVLGPHISIQASKQADVPARSRFVLTPTHLLAPDLLLCRCVVQLHVHIELLQLTALSCHDGHCLQHTKHAATVLPAGAPQPHPRAR